jgi:hypothetical protein
MGGRRGGDCIAGRVQGQHSRGRAEAGAIRGGLCGAARGAGAARRARDPRAEGNHGGVGVGGRARHPRGAGFAAREARAGFAARGSQADRILGGGSLHLGLNSCRDTTGGATRSAAAPEPHCMRWCHGERSLPRAADFLVWRTLDLGQIRPADATCCLVLEVGRR